MKRARSSRQSRTVSRPDDTDLDAIVIAIVDRATTEFGRQQAMHNVAEIAARALSATSDERANCDDALGLFRFVIRTDADVRQEL